MQDVTLAQETLPGLFAERHLLVPRELCACARTRLALFLPSLSDIGTPSAGGRFDVSYGASPLYSQG